MKIAISGKLGSGKSSFLEIARKHYPEMEFQEGKFAQPIYECTHLIQHYLGLPNKKDGNLLQLIGNHYRTEIGKDFWVYNYFKYEPEGNIILTDMRFPEEVDAAKDNYYQTIRIYREEGERFVNLGNRDPHHISEIALDRTPDGAFDYIVNNSGSFDMFEGAVISIINELKRKQ